MELPIKILRIDHLGIAVRNLDQGEAMYGALGLVAGGREIVESQKVQVSFLRVGESNIELLEPTADDSPIAKFLAAKGEGIHHVCYEVQDIDGALAQLRAKGFRLVNETAVPGAHGARVAFLHPKSTGGVLVELKELP